MKLANEMRKISLDNTATDDWINDCLELLEKGIEEVSKLGEFSLKINCESELNKYDIIGIIDVNDDIRRELENLGYKVEHGFNTSSIYGWHDHYMKIFW